MPGRLNSDLSLENEPRLEWVHMLHKLDKNRRVLLTKWKGQTSNILDKRILFSDEQYNANRTAVELQQTAVKNNKAVVRTVNELYDAATQGKPHFDNDLINLTKSSKFPIITSLTSQGWQWWENRLEKDEYTPHLILMPLKSKIRIKEKAQMMYRYHPHPSFSWVYDVLRASFVVSSETQVCYTVDLIKSCPKFRIISLKNRFKEPFYTGYQDVLIHLIYTYEEEVDDLPIVNLVKTMEAATVSSNATESLGSRRRTLRLSRYANAQDEDINAAKKTVNLSSNGKRLEKFSFICEIQIHHIEVLKYSHKLDTISTYNMFRNFFNDAIYLNVILTSTEDHFSTSPQNPIHSQLAFWSSNLQAMSLIGGTGSVTGQSSATTGTVRRSSTTTPGAIAPSSVDLKRVVNISSIIDTVLQKLLAFTAVPRELNNNMDNLISSCTWIDIPLLNTFAIFFRVSREGMLLEKTSRAIDRICRMQITMMVALGIQAIDSAAVQEDKMDEPANSSSEYGLTPNVAVQLAVKSPEGNIVKNAEYISEPMLEARAERSTDTCNTVSVKEFPNNISSANSSDPKHGNRRSDGERIIEMIQFTLVLAHTRMELAIFLKSQVRLEESLQLIVGVISIFNKLLGQNNNFYIEALTFQAHVLCSLDRTTDALSVAQLAHSCRVTTVGRGHPDTLLVLKVVADIFFALRDWTSAKALFEELFSSWHAFEGVCKKTADALFRIGVTLENSGMLLEAIAAHQQAYDMRVKLCTEHDMLVADSLFEIGQILDELGRFKESEGFLRRSLFLKRDILGKRHPDSIHALSFFARVVDECARHEEAIELFNEALVLGSDAFGTQSLEIAELNNDLAECLLNVSRANDAADHFEFAFNIREAQLGENHPCSLQSLTGIWKCFESEAFDYSKGLTYNRKRVVAKAKELARFGEHSMYSRAIDLLSKANESRDKGDFKEASKFLDELSNLLYSIFPDSHPEIALLLCNKGLLMEDQCFYEQALELYLKAEAVVLKSLGETSLITVMIRTNKGLVLRRLGRIDEALDQFTFCLEVRLQYCEEEKRRRMLKDDCPETQKVFSLKELSKSTGIKMKHVDDLPPPTSPGLSKLRMAMTTMAENGHRSHTPSRRGSPKANSSTGNRADAFIELTLIDISDHEVAALLHNMGQCYRSKRQYVEAQECLEKSVLLRHILLGEDHPDYTATLNTLGLVLIDAGSVEDALDPLERSLAARLAIFERRNAFVSTVLNNIGMAHFLLKDNAVAGMCLQESLDTRVQLLGAREPETKTALQNLSLLFESQGDFGLAEGLRKRLDLVGIDELEPMEC